MAYTAFTRLVSAIGWVTRKAKAETYTVTATAEDAAGNTTTRRATVQVVVPATPVRSRSESPSCCSWP